MTIFLGSTANFLAAFILGNRQSLSTVALYRIRRNWKSPERKKAGKDSEPPAGKWKIPISMSGGCVDTPTKSVTPKIEWELREKCSEENDQVKSIVKSQLVL